MMSSDNQPLIGEQISMSLNSNLLRTPSLEFPLLEEATEVLASGQDVRIERIVSTGQSSPDGFWYDSDQWEWVAVLSGEGKLRFEEEPDFLHLKAGDHITIAPHKRHRVEWTSPTEPTIWLAVYFTNPHSRAA